MSNLVDSLIEIADELDKGWQFNSDMNWLKYQGDVLRTVALILQEK